MPYDFFFKTSDFLLKEMNETLKKNFGFTIIECYTFPKKYQKSNVTADENEFTTNNGIVYKIVLLRFLTTPKVNLCKLFGIQTHLFHSHKFFDRSFKYVKKYSI